jgi:hypothetical protein
MKSQFQEFLIGKWIFFGGFVSHIKKMTIPASAGVSKVKGFVEIHIEIRLILIAQGFIIVFSVIYFELTLQLN